MNIEAHKRAMNESLDEIRNAVRTGLEKRQRTIGFHCSAAALDMLEIFLHDSNLISPGATIKHDLFASINRAKSKLPDFNDKNKVISLLVELESKRNILVYGKAQNKENIESYLETFNKIKDILGEMGVEYE